MKKQLATLVLLASLGALMPGVGYAKGCIKGAAVGGVAGHVAGHHGVVGATAGCVIGRHRANVKDKQAAQQQQQQQQPASPQSPAPNSGQTAAPPK